jgi:DNA helicase-2/ATP-dependent DNA helicase PcrA
MDAAQNHLPLTDLFASLTDAQRAAVEHIDGPMLTLAGPGSGKTRVVTHRIANLLRHGIQPRNILALTFTNKAADEMRSRLQALAPGQPVWMGTFHRFCARLLRIHAPLIGLGENFSIYDMDDSRKLLKSVLEEEKLESTHASPDAIAHAISTAKNNLVTPDK